MKPRKEMKPEPRAKEVPRKVPKRPLEIVKLEQRIAPRITDIIDGTSNTLLVGERPPR